MNERMEYSFALDASATDTPGAFAARQYTGQPLAWTSFDYTATPLGAVTAPGQPVTRTLIPTPVGFKGMPARRFWEMEDAVVDIGAIEAGPADLGRLMLREFALIYGNDWFVVPIPVLVGSVSRVSSLVVTDTFGVSQTIPHYSQTADGGRWRMFAVSGDAAPHRLLIPPVLARSIVSDPIEQLLLVRDEAANMAWGIERIVQGASGAPFYRASVPPAAAASQDTSPTILRYELGTSVPEAYIPFIAAPINAVQRRMQCAAFLRTDGSQSIVATLGRLLAANVPLFEEEFAREGVKVASADTGSRAGATARRTSGWRGARRSARRSALAVCNLTACPTNDGQPGADGAHIGAAKCGLPNSLRTRPGKSHSTTAHVHDLAKWSRPWCRVIEIVEGQIKETRDYHRPLSAKAA